MAIRATDNEGLARQLWSGGYKWDEERSQFVPTAGTPVEPSESEEDEAEGQNDGTGEVESYEGETWTKEALQREASDRGLTTSGTKLELAERLRSDDSREEQE
jgi:hypothetical protein